LAYGKAIITTSIGAEGIPYSSGKDILIADSGEDFTKAIIDLLTNDEKKQSLQSAARKLAEQTFDYKSIAKRLISFYEEIK
jgi:glycosyltransferase involved in cell wall biosynthesis